MSQVQIALWFVIVFSLNLYYTVTLFNTDADPEPILRETIWLLTLAVTNRLCTT